MSNYVVDISQSCLENLVAQAQSDGIQKMLGGAHIYRDGRLLLLVRADDEFMAGLTELPSGTIDQNETLIDGLVREVKEETGLKVIRIKKIIDYFDYLSGSGKKTRQFNFLVDIDDSPIVLNPKEHKEYKFVDINNMEDLKNLGISDAVQNSILKTLSLMNDD